MKLAILDSATINPVFDEDSTENRHFKERCYYLVDDAYDFAANSATEILGAEAVEWIAELINLGRVAELSLDEYKVVKQNEINSRTGELIALGYVYATKTFSLSRNAQANLNGANQTRDELTYPVTFNTLDDLDTYDVVDATDMHNMYLTALGTVKAHYNSGTDLKVLVRAAVDKAAVDAIIDNR